MSKEAREKYFSSENGQSLVKESVSRGLVDYDDAYKYITGGDLASTLQDITNSNLNTEEKTAKLKELADVLGIDVERLEEYRQSLIINAESKALGDSITNLSKKFGLLEEASDEVNQVFEDLDKHGYVTTDTINKLKEQFSDVEDFEEYAARLSDVGASEEQHKQALNELYTAYIDQKGILNNLSEETKDLAIAELKRLGVENAEQVVLSRLLETEIRHLHENNNLVDSTGAVTNSAQQLINK